MQGIQILGMGKALPARCVENEELKQYVDTSDEWIRTRTGIETRYFAEKETNLDLASEAAENALKSAGIAPGQIGAVVIATITADYATPSAAALLQARLGIPEDVPAFDINAACSGFVYGLNITSAMLGSDLLRRPYVLLIGVETLTRMLNLYDRGTAVLFGDGGAAAVITASDAHRFYGRLGSCGNKEALNTPGLNQPDAFIHMDGREVFRFAVGAIKKGIHMMEEESGVFAEEIDYIVCHQANKRIIDNVRRSLKLKEEQFYINLTRYGNTSGGSVPLALADMWEEGLLKEGTRIFAVGFGGGLTWACSYIEF